MKPIIISQRVDHYPGRNETRDALDQKLIEMFVEVGFIPYPIPNALFLRNTAKDLFFRWISAVNPVAIVLSGGNDIGEYPLRDACSHALLSYAEKQFLPMLGICGGMQQMAVHGKADLNEVSGHIATRHRISGEINREVNSYHKFSITQCPKEFRVIARSDEGAIEAIAHKVLPWEGWMWHPERETKFVEEDILRIQRLFAR